MEGISEHDSWGPGMKQERLTAAPRSSGRFRWHHLYFVLAAFDLVTLSGGGYLSHRIMGLHEASVTDNRQWGYRLGTYATLGQLAGNVNAPGNDVFDTADVNVERVKLTTAHRAFIVALNAARA